MLVLRQLNREKWGRRNHFVVAGDTIISIVANKEEGVETILHIGFVLVYSFDIVQVERHHKFVAFALKGDSKNTVFQPIFSIVTSCFLGNFVIESINKALDFVL